MTLLTTDQVIARGWTRSMVHRLLSPDKVEQYRANGWDVKRHWYSLRRVSAAERSTAFRRAKMKCERARISRSANAVRKREMALGQKFSRKYKAADLALVDGCDALFSLNRYAKHRSCTLTHQEEIYELKYDFIRLLYALRLCVECSKHIVPGKECYRCNGTGTASGDWDHDDTFQDDTCFRCGGSGWYQEQQELLHFRFRVADKDYSWHVPAEQIGFPCAMTGQPRHWTSSKDEKPVTLASTKFARAKALLGWIIDQKQKWVEVKERVAENLAYRAPVHKTHGESLEQKLAKLGDPSPDHTAYNIRRGSKDAVTVFRELKRRRMADFREQIARQLAYLPQSPHKQHGQPLSDKLLEAVPKGMPFRLVAARTLCARVRAGELSYRDALAILKAAASAGVLEKLKL